uniref:DDE-1 domain-containing protein n=1 Tax=Scylla olivacea TaxID=85551 RepID=A0A0P4VR89_SCYOL
MSEWFHNHFVPDVIHFQTKLQIATDNVKAILLLDNTPAHPSTDELEAHCDRIKAIFMPPNTSSLVKPMDQGVIEHCKRYYRNKQLEECLVMEEEVGKEDTRRAKLLVNFKSYNIRNAVYNWAEAWNNLQSITLSNAWNKLLKGTEVEVDFTGLGPQDFIDTAHRSGEVDVTEENVVEWLESDMHDYICMTTADS